MELNLSDYIKPQTPEETTELVLDILDNDELIDNSGDEEDEGIKLYYELTEYDIENFRENFDDIPLFFVSVIEYYNLNYTYLDNGVTPQLFIFKNDYNNYVLRVQHYDEDRYHVSMLLKLKRKEMFEFIKFMDKFSIPLMDIMNKKFSLRKYKSARK